MALRFRGREHRLQEVNPMQTLRASAIAVPFVILALLVAILSTLLGAGA